MWYKKCYIWRLRRNEDLENERQELRSKVILMKRAIFWFPRYNLLLLETLHNMRREKVLLRSVDSNIYKFIFHWEKSFHLFSFYLMDRLREFSCLKFSLNVYWIVVFTFVLSLTCSLKIFSLSLKFRVI